MHRISLIGIGALLFVNASASAQKLPDLPLPRKTDLIATDPPNVPFPATAVPKTHEVTLNGHVFTLPVGFEIELLAGPPLVERPISVAQGEHGTLYVSDSSGTNDKVAQQLVDRPHRILRLEDTNQDGKYDKSSVFADKMMFPEGTLWHDGSLYVSAPPSIWKLTDTDGDGVADKREEWFKGRTLGGCANDLHGPYLGPDGWLYWCKGGFEQQTYERVGKSLRVIPEEANQPDASARDKPKNTWTSKAAHIFRARPDGSGLEVVMTGGMDNPVDVVFTPGGERIFTTTFLQNPGNGKRDGLIHAIYGGVYGKQHNVVEDHKRTGELMPPMTHLGPAAPCGLAIVQSDVLGPDYLHNLLACQFNLRKVSRHELKFDGGTFTTIDHDFLVSNNLDFHPTDVIEPSPFMHPSRPGVIVVDTGGWYKLCCPTSQLHKPDVLGAIYLVSKSKPKRVESSADDKPATIVEARMPPMKELKPSVLVSLALSRIGSPHSEQALREIARRGAECVPEILSRDFTRGVAAEVDANRVWALTRIDHPDARKAVRTFLLKQNDVARQAALNSVSLWRDAGAIPELRKLLEIGTPPNRRVAAEALGRIGDKGSVPHLLASVKHAEDRALEHAIVYALIEIADPLPTGAGIESSDPAVQRVALLALDQMDASLLKAPAVAELLSSPEPKLKETAAWIIGRHAEWGGALAGNLSQRLAAKSLSEADRAELEKQLAQFAKNADVQTLIASAALGQGVPALSRASALAAMRDSGLKELPAEWVAAIVAAFAHDDLNLASRAVAAVRTVPVPKGSVAELAAALVKLSRQRGLPPALRLEALAAVPGGVKDLDGETFNFLRGSLATDQSVATRGTAAEVLAKAKLSAGQLTGLAHALAKAGPLESDRLLAAFEQSTDEQIGLKVIESLKKSPGRAGLRPGSLEAKFAKYPAPVKQGAFELAALANVDLAKQRSKLEELVEATKGGDIRRGQAVFMRTKTACNVCHQFGYVGGGLGPDLTRIGGIRSERDLLEAIVFPSSSFVRSFEPVVVVTTEGKSHSGLLKKDAPDEVVVAISATETARIPREQIEEIRPGQISLMPSGLDQQLTVQELADLVAFLKNAK